MNDNPSEMYSVNSGYYDLPVKEPWVCGKTLYSVITISSAVLVGVATACFCTVALWQYYADRNRHNPNRCLLCNICDICSVHLVLLLHSWMFKIQSETF